MNARGPGGGRWLGVGLVVSLVLHGALGAVLVSASWAGQGGGDERHREDHPAMSPEDRVRLGLDRAAPVSINWLGIETPSDPHVARDVAESEQAALAAETAGGAPSGAEAVSPVEPTPAQAEAPAPAERAADPAPGVAEAPEVVVGPEPVVTARGWEEPVGPPNPDPPEPMEAERAPVEPAEAAVAQAAPQRPATTGQGETMGPGAAAQPGAPAERESDAVALEETLDVRSWTTPVVGEGIELITVRPRWPTHFVGGRLTRPALVAITLRRTEAGGVVRRAEFVRVEREDGSFEVLDSGDPAVDSIVLNTIYQWRARGKAIESLGPEESLVVRLRLFTVR